MSALVLRAVERQLIVYRRTWRASAFSMFAQPALFLGAMGLGLGGLVDDAGELGSADYLVFVVPGLLCASAMLSAAGDSLWGIMAGVKWMGQYNAMVSTSMTPGDVFGGHVIYTAIRTGMSGAVFLLVAGVLGGLESWFAPLALVPVLLMGALTAAGLGAYSVRQEGDGTFPLIMRLGIMPLFLFSGTFFPVDRLPDAAQPFVWLSPLFHAVEAARDATDGGLGGGTLLHLGLLGGLLAALMPVGIRRFTDRLTP